MILITGSAGKTGRSVIQALVARGIPVRALVRRDDQVAVLETLGANEILVGDMRSREVIERSVQGVAAVYHIPPNMSPDELSIGKSLIAAAETEAVEHFVFHSVLKPQIKAMPHHWNKLLVEEQLIQSNLPYTILQPAAYMQNLLAHWERIIQDGLYPVPYPAGTRLSLVDLQDVARAAAIVLTEPGHHFAAYELVGTEGLSQSEVAARLSRQLSREVEVAVVPLEQWRREAAAAGLGDYQIDTLVKMFTYYSEHGFEGSATALAWLLGHPPTSFDEFVQQAREARAQEKEARLV
jgi:uncharacterized protein YbjT (DUF2867 family)